MDQDHADYAGPEPDLPRGLPWTVLLTFLLLALLGCSIFLLPLAIVYWLSQ